jgi:hypothetical protein
LVKACIEDIFPPLPAIADYFGFDNAANDENLSFILGLYQYMIKLRGMNKNIIEEAFHKNQLDKLIHDSYKTYGNTGFYKLICDKNMKIGKTYLT